MTLFLPERDAIRPGPSTDCLVFAWIGQSFESCDACGLPERLHPFRGRLGGARPFVRVKQYERFVHRWVWRDAVINDGFDSSLFIAVSEETCP